MYPPKFSPGNFPPFAGFRQEMFRRPLSFRQENSCHSESNISLEIGMTYENTAYPGEVKDTSARHGSTGNMPGLAKRGRNMLCRHVNSAIPSKRISSLRVAMQIVVSLLLLLPCLVVILSNSYDPNSKHWAIGTVGTILGFWLRGGSR